MSIYLNGKKGLLKNVKNGFDVMVSFDNSNMVFEGHYPGNPIFPASLVIDICYSRIINYWNKRNTNNLRVTLKRSVFFKGIKPDDNILFCYRTSFDELTLTQVRADFFLKEDKLGSLTFDVDKVSASINNINLISDLEFFPAIGYLPQRHPLLVVDEVCHINGRKGYARKYISYSDYTFKGNTTKHYYYPHGAVIEGIEQSAVCLLELNWPLIKTTDIKVLVGGISGVHFYKNAVPGDIIFFESKILYLSKNNAILEGAAYVNEKEILSIEKIFVVVEV